MTLANRNIKRLLFYFVIILSISSCTPLESLEQSSEPQVLSDTSILALQPISNYELTPKDTFYNEWENGGHSEEIEIGVYVTDSVMYNVITEFSLMPIADGYRSTNMLYLITPEHKQFAYQASSKEELPLDLYQNNFVFSIDNDTFFFTTAALINKEKICFGEDWNNCLMKGTSPTGY